MYHAYNKSVHNEVCHPGGHFGDYWKGTLSIKQVTEIPFEYLVPTDFIYVFPIFKWVAMAWLNDRVSG